MIRRLLVVLALAVPAVAFAQQKIVIDPGHGGSDPGGVGTGMQEKNVVLDVSKRFKALLDADTADTSGGGKWTSYLTRSTDVYVSLAGRSAYSNDRNADRFMSIHANAFGDASANGTETFSFASTGPGAQMRNLVQAEMLAAWGLTNRGNKTANFAVLRDTAAPAELHELSFITNATDAAKLASPAERQKAAVAHLRAIQRVFGITPYVPGTPAATDGEINGLVVDADGPVADATVKLEGTMRSVVTDADGHFTLMDVALGKQMITASAETHKPRTVEVTVASSASPDITIELERTTTVDPMPEPMPSEDSGGCTTGRTSGAGLLLLALFFVRRRQR